MFDPIAPTGSGCLMVNIEYNKADCNENLIERRRLSRQGLRRASSEGEALSCSQAKDTDPCSG